MACVLDAWSFGPPAAVWQKQKDAELSSGCRVCLTANYTLTVTYCAGRALTFFKSSLPPFPISSHLSVRSFIPFLQYRLVSASSLETRQK